MAPPATPPTTAPMAAPSHPPAIAPTPAPTAAPAPAPIAVFLPGVAHPPRTTTAEMANRKLRIRSPPQLTGTVELALRVPCRVRRSRTFHASRPAVPKGPAAP